jgi:hypothetical protein
LHGLRDVESELEEIYLGNISIQQLILPDIMAKVTSKLNFAFFRDSDCPDGKIPLITNFWSKESVPSVAMRLK